MYLIKVCPGCKTKIRFPIDRGTIRVKCTCGYSFIANPDDTGIYRDASFDLSHTTAGLKKMTPLRQWIGDIRVRGLVPFLVTSALGIKYKIQNFSLLPGAEKKKIVIALLAFGAVVVAAVVAAYILTRGSATPRSIVI